MISSAQLLREKGASDLSGRWGEAALFTFVYYVLAAIFSATVAAGVELLVPGVGTLLSLLVIPMGWSYYVTFLANHRKTDADPFNVARLFDGYHDFVRIFFTTLLTNVYIFLWTLLLIVPGIIKGISYSMAPYILAREKGKPAMECNKEAKYNEAIELSMAMMEGHKMELLWLYLTFIGWAILCIFTLGIGYFWLVPYMSSTFANFYEEVKADYQSKSL